MELTLSRSLAIFALLLAVPASAAAQLPVSNEVECSEYLTPEERRDAERLVVRGVACFERQEYLIALRHYREARRLSDSNLLNAALGRVFQELGYPYIARRYYRDYLAGQVEDVSARERIESRLAVVEREIEQENGEVTFESSPPGATVNLVILGGQWEDLGRTPMTVALPPGQHEVVIQGDGYLTKTEKITVSRGAQPTNVDSSLVSNDAAFGMTGQRLRRIGAITMLASAPFIASGAVFYVAGTMKKSDGEAVTEPRRSELIDSGGKQQRTGVVLGIIGLAALSTGVVLYVFGQDELPGESETPSSARLDAIVGPGSVGLQLAF